jgi:RNA polymerase sigma-70 factor (ECF subfamily)
LGSFDDAEDLVQDTFLRAWRARDTFDAGDGSRLRAWLYRIATNACLDALRRRSRQGPTARSPADLPWLQPYPDRLLNEIVADDPGPETTVLARETIELAFLAAIQLLPSRQRAVVILRDVLGWSAIESAQALDLTVPAANSALQRARASLREHLPERRLDWAGAPSSAEERALLLRFIDAHERADTAAMVALAREDIRVTMPPHPWCFDGQPALAALLARAFDPSSSGRWRLVPTSANRQPAAASYRRVPGDRVFRAVKLDVLRIEEGQIAEITTFGAGCFPSFSLPPVLG